MNDYENCKQMREMTSAYRDGELSSAEHEAVAAHLSTCAECRQVLASVDAMANLLKKMPVVQMERDLSTIIGRDDEKCKEISELMSAYRDNELSQSERLTVEEHLTNCSACLDVLASVDAVANILKRMPAVQLERDLTSAIEKRILESQKIKPFAIARRKVFVISAVAAAVALCAVAGSYFLHSSSTVPVTASLETPNVGTSSPAKDRIENKVASTQTIKSEKEHPQKEALKKEDRVHEEIASREAVKPPVKTEEKSGKAEQLDKTVVASHPVVSRPSTPVINYEELSANQAVVADSESNNVFNQMGVGTDEDGLYAIKM